MILYQLTHQKDVSHLSDIIPNLDFVENIFGDEIPNFLVTNPMVQELQEYLHNYKIKETSGLFRKPYKFIHFENYEQLDEWIVVYCIEDLTFNIYNQKDINYIFDIKEDLTTFIQENCYDPNRWIVNTSINIKSGQILMFRSWLFHSFSSGLGHYFFMEYNNDN